MVMCQRAGGWCGDGGGAGGDGRLRWGAAEPGHGMADAARAGAAWADAWLWGLGRRCVPPGCAGYQAAAGRRGRRGMTGQDQHHRAGEGGGASYRPQRQVRLRPGQCVRPPRVGGSLVPRHVTGTLAHCPITPGAIRGPWHHGSSGIPGNSAGSGPHDYPCLGAACGLCGAGSVTGTIASGDGSWRSPLGGKRWPSAGLRSPLRLLRSDQQRLGRCLLRGWLAGGWASPRPVLREDSFAGIGAVAAQSL